MKLTALLNQSLRSIWSNKVRSGLTILGIVIGIASVIALVGLGKGLQASVESRLGELDATAITVRSQSPERLQAQRMHEGMGMNGSAFMFGNAPETITPGDYDVIQKTSGVVAASPELQTRLDVTLTANAETATAYDVYGIDTQYFSIKDVKVIMGDGLTASRVETSESVVVVGKNAASELFPGETTYIGKTIYIKDQPFTIIGIVEQDKAATNTAMGKNGSNVADNIYTGHQRWMTLNAKTKLTNVIATAKDESSTERTADSIEGALLKAHGISDKSKADVTASTSKELLSTIENVTSGFSMTLTGIAAISLLVGGIGIMNIMLVTVTERTREIGLRRAVGAKTRHILLQFLVESVILTSIGGLLGLAFGIFLANQAGSMLSSLPTAGVTLSAVVDASTIILALSISTVVGIVFGLFPAVKAARLDPVDALRYE